MRTQEFTVPFDNTEVRSVTETVVRTEEWLVCLHGIQSNRHLFDRLKTDTRFNDFSLLAIDAVGFGDSD
jgi:pimeloyl-ACP methyl ester carboxylesterase